MQEKTYNHKDNIINLISFYFNPSFYYKKKDSLDDIKKNIEIHIDHLSKCGWQKEQIIIKTNFNFNYRGIHNTNFIYNCCPNPFLTKIIAAYEVLSTNPNHILWQHDHDAYQLRPFNLSLLSTILVAEMNLCNYYPMKNKPQAASIFYVGMSKTLEDMYNFIRNADHKFLMRRKYYDEELIADFKSSHSISTDLPYCYNTSLTKSTHNKRKSEIPYVVHGDLLRRFKNRFNRKIYFNYLNKYPCLYIETKK